MITTTPTSATTRPPVRLRRRLAHILTAGLTMLLGAAALTATPAHAQEMGNNAPNYTLNPSGYGVSVSLMTGCDLATKSMSISLSASIMQKPGYAGGYTTGPYDVTGQSAMYNIWTRDVTTNGPFVLLYSWSPWQHLTGIVSNSNVERLAILTDLGTNMAYGKAGHSYQVAVQIDWWTGAHTVGTFYSTYAQSNRGLMQYPSACMF